MSNINYKEYVSQLGKIETDAKARIKAYLEKQIEQDECLRGLYRPEKIDDCYNFITNAVQELPRTGNGLVVEDAIIWKMARDYFIEILPKEADEPPEVKESKAAEPEEAEAETPPAEAGVDIENSAEAEEAAEEKAMPSEADGGDRATQERAAEEGETPIEEEAKSDESAGVEYENSPATDEFGFEIYGEQAEEEGAETAAQEEGETPIEEEAEKAESAGVEYENSPEAENEKPESSEVQYDENGNGLLFDFE